MRQTKFHGQYAGTGRVCAHPTCEEPGEFRAPSGQSHGFDGPAEWRWLCLDHVREFNAGYDWFEGMSAEEIFAAQAPEDTSLYRHIAEGGDDMPAHIKGALTQTQLSIPVSQGKMLLGTWQGIYLFEHRRIPRDRDLVLHLAGD